MQRLGNSVVNDWPYDWEPSNHGNSWDDWVNSEDVRVYEDTTPAAERSTDRMNKAEVLTFKAERVLREVVIDFGIEFARDRRHRIEALVQKLRFCISLADEKAIDVTASELMNEVYEINRAAYLYDLDNDDDDAASAAVVRR